MPLPYYSAEPHAHRLKLHFSDFGNGFCLMNKDNELSVVSSLDFSQLRAELIASLLLNLAFEQAAEGCSFVCDRLF
jgi:hypothetical protein